ncbi:MAG: arginine--tRNA ligase [Saprospiraceae bacterium]|nr:arginine--tRNA ligase [Saprospiraceae bacterium]
MNIQYIIQQLISESLADLYSASVQLGNIPVTLTKPEIKGDYTVTLFPFAKELKLNPHQMGQNLKDSLSGRHPHFSSIEVAGGFLNFTLSDDYWISVLNEVNTQIQPEEEKLKYIIEFSSPNTNKPLHLGHIRNILLGDSMSNILNALGHNVTKVQVINDRGIAICKSMVAYKLFGEGKDPQSLGVKGDHFVGDMYVLFDTKLKEEYKAWQSSDEAAQMLAQSGKSNVPEEFFAEYKNQYFNRQSELGLIARKMLSDWEAGDEATLQLWKTMNSWVYDGMNETYKRLGITFDKNYYESQTYLLGKQAVNLGLEKGIFTRQEDSSVWIDLTDRGLDRKLLLRSDGTSVYITQDIGLALQRYDEFQFDRMVYVVADEQNYHFQVLFQILKTMGEKFADNLYHLSYGMVELPTGKMKSREGTVVDADDLIAEVVTEAAQSGQERGGMALLSQEERDEIFRIIGLGALKYHMIKVAPKKKMIFDPLESVDMQGQTSPYIQNAYVRIQSILRREKPEVKSVSGIHLDNQEIELIKWMTTFEETVRIAGRTYDPSQLANYLYALAKTLHRYYHDVPILTAQEDSIKTMRLLLISKVSDFLKVGMKLLGIEMPERM